MDYTHVILSGGGLAGICYTGVLHSLQQSQSLLPAPTIKHIAGTSIGAFFAFLFTLGVPMMDVINYVESICQQDPHHDPFAIHVTDFIRFPQTYGLLNPDALLSIAKHFCRQVLQKDDVTFRELTQRRAISLTVTATELYTRSTHFFSIDTSPNASVLECIRASISIPIVFPPVRISDPSCEGCLYVDGFLLENFPTHAYSEHGYKKTFGVFTKIDFMDPHPNPTTNTNPHIFEYLGMIFSILDKNPTISRMEKEVDTLLVLDNPPFHPLAIDFQKMRYDITPETLQKTFLYGKTHADKKLKLG